MYKIEFGKGVFKQTKYFHTYGESAEYCKWFNWSVKRIKEVH